MRTDDALRDFNDWDYENKKYIDSLPKCEHCGEPIDDDYYYYIDEEVLCESCMKDAYRKSIN